MTEQKFAHTKLYSSASTSYLRIWKVLGSKLGSMYYRTDWDFP